VLRHPFKNPANPLQCRASLRALWGQTDMTDDEFGWDDAKAASNLEKHKISFETARKVFADPDRIEDFDSDSSYEEDRYFCIGAVEFKVYYVIYTLPENGCTWIISARPANKRETNGYYRRKTAG
jgi:uncharacterized protein